MADDEGIIRTQIQWYVF